MKTKLITSAFVALVAIGSNNAFAGNFDYNSEAQILPAATSTVTRAQVRADYSQAAKNGSLIQESEAGFMFPTTIKSQQTRAEVKAQAVYANSRSVPALNPGA